MSSDPTADRPDDEQASAQESPAEQPSGERSSDVTSSGERPSQERSAEPRPVPDAEELARVAEPATVRRAPRYRTFVLSGVVVGAVVAFVLVLTLGGGEGSPETDTGMVDVGGGPVLIFTALTLCLIGALLGGLVALLLDRRSRR